MARRKLRRSTRKRFIVNPFSDMYFNRRLIKRKTNKRRRITKRKKR